MPFFTGKQTCQKLGLSRDASGGFLLGKKLSKTFLSMLKKQLKPYSGSVKTSTFKRKPITFKPFVSKVAKLILFDYSRQKFIQTMPRILDICILTGCCSQTLRITAL